MPFDGYKPLAETEPEFGFGIYRDWKIPHYASLPRAAALRRLNTDNQNKG